MVQMFIVRHVKIVYYPSQADV